MIIENIDHRSTSVNLTIVNFGLREFALLRSSIISKFVSLKTLINFCCLKPSSTQNLAISNQGHLKYESSQTLVISSLSHPKHLQSQTSILSNPDHLKLPHSSAPVIPNLLPLKPRPPQTSFAQTSATWNVLIPNQHKETSSSPSARYVCTHSLLHNSHNTL